MAKNILIVGATSAVAQATARLWATEQARFYLVGRKGEKLASVQNDLLARGASSVATFACDLLDFNQHARILSSALELLGSLDLVFIAHGSLPEQKACAQDYGLAAREISINFLSIVSLLTPIANHFEAKKAGAIAVISSVAGDRGRASNYIYGAAKGGLSIFLAGLRNRLAPFGVQVLTIKLGFIDTPMTAHLEKGPLFVKPAVVAHGICRAVTKKRNIVYLPWFWRFIMGVVCRIPEGLFKKLRL